LAYQANELKDVCQFSAFSPTWNAPESMGMQSSFECETNLIEGYLNGKSLNKITLIGTDGGAGMALAFASRHPERVEKLIMSNCMANPDCTDWASENQYPDGYPDRIE
jgi:pimeloyl-ACP methyl ester carboxylesterase